MTTTSNYPLSYRILYYYTGEDVGYRPERINTNLKKHSLEVGVEKDGQKTVLTITLKI